MTYEVFNHTREKVPRPALRATIRSTGDLFLNSYTLAKVGATDAASVKLLFDKSTDRLAIKFFKEFYKTDDVTWLEKLYKNPSGLYVRLNGFLRRYKLPHPSNVFAKYKSLTPTFEGDMVILNLHEYRKGEIPFDYLSKKGG